MILRVAHASALPPLDFVRRNENAYNSRILYGAIRSGDVTLFAGMQKQPRIRWSSGIWFVSLKSLFICPEPLSKPYLYYDNYHSIHHSSSYSQTYHIAFHFESPTIHSFIHPLSVLLINSIVHLRCDIRANNIKSPRNARKSIIKNEKLVKFTYL